MATEKGFYVRGIGIGGDSAELMLVYGKLDRDTFENWHVVSPIEYSCSIILEHDDEQRGAIRLVGDGAKAGEDQILYTTPLTPELEKAVDKCLEKYELEFKRFGKDNMNVFEKTMARLGLSWEIGRTLSDYDNSHNTERYNNEFYDKIASSIGKEELPRPFMVRPDGLEAILENVFNAA